MYSLKSNNSSGTELTGITQEVIDDRGVSFEDALAKHVLWMMSHGLDVYGRSRGKVRKKAAASGSEDEGCDKTFLIVTCGDWDLLQMLPRQLGHLSPGPVVPTCYQRIATT